MTIKEFVETAIEGGWGGSWKKKPVVTMLENECVGFSYAGSLDGISMSISNIVLQPDAWKAVIKSKLKKERDAGYETNDQYISDIAQTKMTEMVRQLFMGKKLEEYIATL